MTAYAQSGDLSMIAVVVTLTLAMLWAAVWSARRDRLEHRGEWVQSDDEGRSWRRVAWDVLNNEYEGDER